MVNELIIKGSITMNSKNKHKYIVKDLNGINVFIDNKKKRKITEKAVSETNKNSNLGYNFLSLYEDSIIENIKNECNVNKLRV